jgi:protoporphyrinogen oxidase
MASVLVVGGGVAGMVCAWRLQHAGYDVEVLERAETPGGRLRGAAEGGFRLERSANLLGPMDANIRVLLRALGLADALYPVDPPDEAVLRRGRFEALEPGSLRSLARSPLVSPRAKFHLLRAGLELARRRPAFDLYHPEQAASLERGDAATDLAALAGSEARDFVLAPLLESWLGVPLSATSDAFVRTVMSALLRRSAPEGLLGGMNALTEALAATVPMRCGARVHSVETEEGGARVRYRIGTRERRALADAVVVAVSGPQVVDLCPKLTPEERGFFEMAVRFPSVVVHALLDEAPKRLPFHRVHFPAALGSDIASIGFEHVLRDAAPPGSGLLRIVLSQTAVSRAWGEEDWRLSQSLIDDLERTPLGSVRPRRCVVQRMDSAATQFGPGSLSRLRSFLARRQRTPRLAFAGADTIGPYTEGVVTSGLRAAADVAHSLEPTS